MLSFQDSATYIKGKLERKAQRIFVNQSNREKVDAIDAIEICMVKATVMKVDP